MPNIYHRLLYYSLFFYAVDHCLYALSIINTIHHQSLAMFTCGTDTHDMHNNIVYIQSVFFKRANFQTQVYVAAKTKVSRANARLHLAGRVQLAHALSDSLSRPHCLDSTLKSTTESDLNHVYILRWSQVPCILLRVILALLSHQQDASENPKQKSARKHKDDRRSCRL
jgi:hypothetical protein